MMKKTLTTGKTNNHWIRDALFNSSITLQYLFERQMANQTIMLENGMYDKFKNDGTTEIPADDVKLMSYHVQQLVSEIGEVLNADKRWKNFRNERYDEKEKLEEIADCFIVLMNVAMFSGFNGIQLTDAILDKLNKVSDRIAK